MSGAGRRSAATCRNRRGRTGAARRRAGTACRRALRASARDPGRRAVTRQPLHSEGRGCRLSGVMASDGSTGHRSRNLWPDRQESPGNPGGSGHRSGSRDPEKSLLTTLLCEAAAHVSRNEGVPGSSPGVGFIGLQGFCLVGELVGFGFASILRPLVRRAARICRSAGIIGVYPAGGSAPSPSRSASREPPATAREAQSPCRRCLWPSASAGRRALATAKGSRLDVAGTTVTRPVSGSRSADPAAPRMSGCHRAAGCRTSASRRGRAWDPGRPGCRAARGRRLTRAPRSARCRPRCLLGPSLAESIVADASRPSATHLTGLLAASE